MIAAVVARVRRHRVPVHYQASATECGATCVAMVSGYHGNHVEVRELRDVLVPGRDGANLAEMAKAARGLGLEARAFRAPPTALSELALPVVANWQQAHFVVLERRSRGGYEIVDPAFGRRHLTVQEFAAEYCGVVLALTPGPDFQRRPRRALGFFRFVLPFVPRSFQRLLTIALASLFLVLLTLIPPAITKFVVDTALPGGDMDVLRALALGAACFALGQATTTLLRAEYLLWLQTAVDEKMMGTFLRHLLDLPYSYFQTRHGGDLMMRASSTIYVRDLLSSNVLAMAIDLLLLGVYLVVIGVQSGLFVVALLVLGAFQVMVMLVTARPAQRRTQREILFSSESQSVLLETVSSVESIKSAGAEDVAYQHWNRIYRDQLRSSVSRRRLDNSVNAVLMGVRTVTPVLLLLLGAVLVLQGDLSLGQMLSIIALTGAALAPIGQLGGNLQALQTVRVHLDRLRDVLEESSESATQEGNRQIVPSGAISLSDVTFRYGSGAPAAVREVDLEIKAGQRIALVGQTGSGKSTLSRLLVGLLTPDDGEIAFDGVPIRDLDLPWLRRHVGVVTQSVEVLSGSIRSNITLTAPDATDDEIERAARLAHLHDDICGMALGYDTVLGERGTGLSGGQRQRLALARALVHRPSILVLDEATSHLDAETERQVFENLRGLECTQIVIAHRLSTVRDMDIIHVVRSGEIVGSGTHAELMRTSQIYAQLVAAQLDVQPQDVPVPAMLDAR